MKVVKVGNVDENPRVESVEEVELTKEMIRSMISSQGTMFSVSGETGEVFRDEFLTDMINDYRVKSMSVSETRKAAQNGDIYAMERMYIGYYEGSYGLKKNIRKAAFWAQRLADAGDSPGQFNLANLYVLGNGVERDWDKAIYYMGLAADQDEPDASLVKMLYIQGRENEIKGRNGDADALFESVRFMIPEHGEEGDDIFYRHLFETTKEAAEMGCKKAEKALVNMYFEGIGTKVNRKKGQMLAAKLDKEM